MENLDRAIDEYIEHGLAEHFAVRVGVGERVLYDTFRGGANENTLFDMASITKILATGTLALMAIDRGLLSVDSQVSDFFDTDKRITVKNLLTHTMGIGHKRLDAPDYTYENIAEKILEIPTDVPVGEQVLYSCPAFILLGKILERIFEKRLDVCFAEMISAPLNMQRTAFLPRDISNTVNANLDVASLGVVNDYNCRHLGGVAGNAGIFSNVSDLTEYARHLLRRGAPLFSEQTFSLAVKNYTPSMSEPRGLAYLYVDADYDQTGGLFSDGAIGHCGHTGQSVFADYRSGLYVILLSDATLCAKKKYGKDAYGEVMKMRARIHSAIRLDLGEI